MTEQPPPTEQPHPTTLFEKATPEKEALIPRLCPRCSQEISPQRDSWQSTPTGIAHVTCPTSPEMAALLTLEPDDANAAISEDAAPAAEGPANAQPAYLTKHEAAELLRVHLNTITEKIRTGELPALRMRGGRRVLLDRRDVVGLLEPISVAENVKP